MKLVPVRVVTLFFSGGSVRSLVHVLSFIFRFLSVVHWRKNSIRYLKINRNNTIFYLKNSYRYLKNHMI